MPWGVLARKLSERDGYVRVISNESVIKVSETEEGLDLFDLLRGRPIADDLNLRGVHLETTGADDKAKEVGRFDAELAFLDLGIKIVGAEAAQYLSYMVVVIGRVIGVDEDVVQVDHDADIQEILEDVIHELLEGGRCIGEAVMHDVELVRTVLCVERGLPLVAVGYVDKIVGTTKVDLGERVGHVQAV